MNDQQTLPTTSGKLREWLRGPTARKDWSSSTDPGAMIHTAIAAGVGKKSVLSLLLDCAHAAGPLPDEALGLADKLASWRDDLASESDLRSAYVGEKRKVLSDTADPKAMYRRAMRAAAASMLRARNSTAPGGTLIERADASEAKDCLDALRRAVEASKAPTSTADVGVGLIFQTQCARLIGERVAFEHLAELMGVDVSQEPLPDAAPRSKWAPSAADLKPAVQSALSAIPTETWERGFWERAYCAALTGKIAYDGAATPPPPSIYSGLAAPDETTRADARVCAVYADAALAEWHKRWAPEGEEKWQSE